MITSSIDFSSAKECDVVITIGLDGFGVKGTTGWMEKFSDALKGTDFADALDGKVFNYKFILVPVNYNKSAVIGKVVAFFEDSGATVKVV